MEHAHRFSRTPLALTYNVDGPSRVFGLKKILNFAGRLTELTITVKSFSREPRFSRRFEFSVIQSLLGDILRYALPVLVTLEIGWDFPKHRPTIHFHHITTPSLKRLTLRNVRLQEWTSLPSALTKIRFLHLIDDPYEDDMHLFCLLGCISMIPALDTLMIDNASPHYDWHRSGVIPRFPSLTRLFLRDRLCRVEPLLVNLSAPNLRVCSVWIGLGVSDPLLETHQQMTSIMNSPTMQARANVEIPADVSLSFFPNDFVEFETIRFHVETEGRFESSRPESLSEIYGNECDADSSLIDGGGYRAHICAFSCDSPHGVASLNLNIMQAEMSMRQGIITALKPTTVRHMNVRGLTHGLGEYMLGIETHTVTLYGGDDIMPPWLWMGDGRKMVRFVECVFSNETKDDIERASWQRGFTVELDGCEYI